MKRFGMLIQVLIILSHSSISQADQYEQTKIEDMIKISNYIVHGEIVNTEVEKVKNNNGYSMYRYTTLEIIDAVKTKEMLHDTIIIKTLEGCTIQGETQLSLTRLQVIEDMEVIAFISDKKQDKFYHLIGGSLGCFPIYESKLNATDTIVNDFKQQLRAFIAGTSNIISFQLHL